ncbi:MAG: hypothetical protein OXN16_13385 [Gammaproteobacteria bacterium]|nr:hypothetical protein [Gammaproteobacteria bacterium]
MRRRRNTSDGIGTVRRTPSWPGDPEGITAADIDFEALAHVLANTCRFGGRTTRYHSLAARAVIVSEEVEALDGLDTGDRKRLALHALLADAPVAWMVGRDPESKKAADRAAKLTRGIEHAVREAAGLDPELEKGHVELLRFVARMADAAERRDLAGAGIPSEPGVAFPPLRRRIKPVDPDRAAKLWLARFHELSGWPRGGTGGASAGGNRAAEPGQGGKEHPVGEARTPGPEVERDGIREAA